MREEEQGVNKIGKKIKTTEEKTNGEMDSLLAQVKQSP